MAEQGTGDDLDLQFDIDEQPAEATDGSAAAEVDQTAQDDDFLDIEQMLEQGDEADSDMVDEEDLSLTMEAALDDAAKGAEDDLEACLSQLFEMAGIFQDIWQMGNIDFRRPRAIRFQ